VQKMFGHKRRTEIKQRAKLMGRMVMLLTDGAQNHTTNLSRAFPIRVTSRMKLQAMLEYRDSRCASRQAAGTRPPWHLQIHDGTARHVSIGRHAHTYEDTAIVATTLDGNPRLRNRNWRIFSL